MESKTDKKKQGGRKPGKDTATHRHTIRMNDEENARFGTLFLQSNMYDKTGFIKHMIFGTVMKTVKIDKAAVDYYIKLSNFYVQFQAIGNNYNQTVKAIKTNFSEKRAFALLGKLEKTTIELIVLNRKIIELTGEFKAKFFDNDKAVK